jgi:hypothetical protein
MENVRFIGNVVLNDEAKRKLNAFIKAHPEGDILEVRVFPNFDATGDETPSGMQIIYSTRAKVDGPSLSPKLFETVAVSKIVGPAERLKDAHFEKQLSEIAESVSQQPEKRINETMRSPKNNKQLDQWSAELSGPGAFAGVYSQLRDDHRTKDYYVLTRSTIGAYVRDIQQLAEEERPTYGDLVYGNGQWKKRMTFGTEMARANVCRAIANIEEAAGIRISAKEPDLLYFRNEGEGHPELAVPDWEQQTHSVRQTIFKGRPAVLVSYGIVPSEDLSSKKFFVIAGPRDGVNVFEINAQNNRLPGVPSDTGRKVALEKIQVNTIDPSLVQGIVWEGKAAADAAHPELHEDAHKPVDKTFKELMRSAGWNPEDHIQKMIPVAAKLWNE